MPTFADSLVSSTARPLNMRVRPDLVVRQTRYHGTPYWVIKDPVGHMEGVYTFRGQDGNLFEVTIPRFHLLYPNAIN